ncbi:MAG: D-alanyl-D-alanine carboxypeptidase [Pseudomonadota bacterium]|nr:D-alanyl-D-alanine carboxypeptidase [Pseudomonadota bacterium]
MYRVSVRALFGRRCGVVGLVATLIILGLAADPAEARWRRRAAPQGDSSAISGSRYADIVVDANSGDVLHAAAADSQRHPASLAKIMTLYLLFERIESGKLKLSTPLEVSEDASEQAPSKLGLRPGQTIIVEDAIKALVTKSANDVAVVVAEAIAGSEDEFSKLMTRKARALGMTRTVYKNASGLPDDDQVTTARDQALLALAIQDRFPRHYRYFSTPRFVYRGHSMRNHNRLLGNVEGVDGIKTGYTRASGFNLVTSVRRGKRQIIAVVFGGRSGAQRDARMRKLIEAHVDEASLNRTAPKIAEREAAESQTRIQVASAGATLKEVAPPTAFAAQPLASPASIARADSTPAPAVSVSRSAPGSTDPIKPHLVKTLSVKAGAAQTAAVAPLMLSPQPVTSQIHATLTPAVDVALPPPPPGARPGVLGVLPAKAVEIASLPNPATPAASMPPAPAAAASPVREIRVHSGWIIQVGAFDDEAEAKQRLNSAKDKAATMLARADSFTEPVVKGDKTLYRARFAGLKQEDAEAVCRHLKRNDIACMAIKN